MSKKIPQKSGKYFTEIERHKIIRELLSSGCTKQAIWQKYTGQTREHGHLLTWMRQLGYDDTSVTSKKPTIVTNSSTMSNKRTISNTPVSKEEIHFELLQLQKRNKELEKKLEEAELKAIAFSTMVDIAEEMFKIPIRKKLNTQP